MKLVIGADATVSGVLFALSMASANPSLLPKHEGYPMKNSGSPVTGQPTANDPGQTNASGEKAGLKAAAFDDKHVQQNLMKTDNARITTGQGANQLEAPEARLRQRGRRHRISYAYQRGSDSHDIKSRDFAALDPMVGSFYVWRLTPLWKWLLS